MSADSGLQDTVDKGREAFRRSMPEGVDLAGAPRRPEIRAEHDVRGSLDLHPFFRGLLETLPEIGADWALAERQQWLETARNIFALLYREPDAERQPIPLRPREPSASPSYPLAEQRSAS